MQGGVYRSEDGGETWVQSAAGMDPNEPVFDLVADPNRAGVFYVSSWQSGVLVSVDGGHSWASLTNGLDFFHMRALALSQDGSVLYAGTRGRGVFRLGTPAGSPPAAEATPAGPAPTARPIAVIPRTAAPAAPPSPTAASRPPVNWLYLGLGAGAIALVIIAFAIGRRSRR